MTKHEWSESILIATTIINTVIGGHLPVRVHEPQNPYKNVVGVASNIVTVNILKGTADTNKNFVFSPIGFSSILAILSEGARGDTFTDIASLLQHPEERNRVRSSYKDILKSLQGDDPTKAPQFKTWLYIYKNNTVDQEFRQIVHDEYFVEVKDVDRDAYVQQTNDIDFNDGISVPELVLEDTDVAKSQSTSNDDTVATVDTEQTSTSSNSKDIPEFETLKKVHESEAEDETRLIDDQKDASKFDEVVEDRQYVEVPVIIEEISKEKKENAEKLKTEMSTENVEPDVESTTFVEQKERKNDKMSNVNKVDLSKAQQRAYFADRKFAGRNDGDGTAVLSGNSIVGEKTAQSNDTEKTETKLLLFNGLYFRGSWATPFQQLRSGLESVFYKSENEKLTIKMMRSRGFYQIAELPNLKCQAIDLPYDNERYSFLILLPNTKSGLKQLLTDFDQTTLVNIVSQLEEQSIDISLPKFDFDTTTGAEKMLLKAGLTSIFTSKADFTGISTEQKLQVGEIQQHVTIRVDEGSSSENFLTASNALRANAQPERSIVVDRPFLFFVRDVVENVIILAGKLTEPTSSSLIHDEPNK